VRIFLAVIPAAVAVAAMYAVHAVLTGLAVTL